MNNIEEARRKLVGRDVDKIDESQFPGQILRIVEIGQPLSTNFLFNRINLLVDGHRIIADVVSDDDLY